MAITIKTGPRNWQFYDETTKKTSETKHSKKTDKQPTIDELGVLYSGEVADMTLAEAEKLHSVYGLQAQITEKVKGIIEKNLSDLAGMTQDQIHTALEEAFGEALGKEYEENSAILDPASLCTFYHSFSIAAHKYFEEKIRGASSLAELRTADSVGEKFNAAMDDVTKEVSATTINVLIGHLQEEVSHLESLRAGAVAKKKELEDAIEALKGLLDKYKLPTYHESRLARKKKKLFDHLPSTVRKTLKSLEDWKSKKDAKTRSVDDLVELLTELRGKESELEADELALVKEWTVAELYGALTEKEREKVAELKLIDMPEIPKSEAESERGA